MVMPLEHKLLYPIVFVIIKTFKIWYKPILLKHWYHDKHSVYSTHQLILFFLAVVLVAEIKHVFILVETVIVNMVFSLMVEQIAYGLIFFLIDAALCFVCDFFPVLLLLVLFFFQGLIQYIFCLQLDLLFVLFRTFCFLFLIIIYIFR